MSTQTLIAHYAEALKASSNLPLPRHTATHLARVIGTLLEDGLTEDAIERGLDLLVQKGLTPGALPGAVIEAAHKKGPSRGDKVCPICGLTFKTEQRQREHLSDVHHVDAPTAVAPSPRQS